MTVRGSLGSAVRRGAVGLAAAAVLLGPGPAAAQDATPVAGAMGGTMQQTPPTLVPVDTGGAGPSVGDGLTFEGSLGGMPGMDGTIVGYHTTVDMRNPGAGEPNEDRLSARVLHFDGGSIVVLGKSVFSGQAMAMDPGMRQYGAVVGGTGRFAGASGQNVTVRQPDDSYTQEISATVPPADAPTREVVLTGGGTMQMTMMPMADGASSHGDRMAFVDIVAGDEGSGEVNGLLTNVLPADPAAGRTADTWVGTLVFSLGNGDSIAAAGEAAIPQGAEKLASEGPYDFAVIGGTGRFIGASGTLTSRRDGKDWTHSFRLFDTGAAASAGEEITLTQAVPELMPIDLGTPGASVGDTLAFEAGVSGDGGPAGQVNGMTVTTDMPDPANNDPMADRVGMMVFDFGQGSTILVVGVTSYPAKSVEIKPDAPQVRAVVGGTGAYAGAKGQLTTTRNDDGTYSQVLQLAG